MSHISILYRDEHLVVVNKPEKMLVHRTEIANGDTEFVLQCVRDQLGRHVYPVHRLDRGTSGALVFALSPDIAREMQALWETHCVRKVYLALVRGWFPEQKLFLDYPLGYLEDPYLKVQKKGTQQAQTRFWTWAQTAVPLAYGQFPSTRLSLVAAEPVTGRRHQIRRHLKHLAHPIIGDATYGKGPLNRALAPLLGSDRLFLHCAALALPHPVTHQSLVFKAPLSDTFSHALDALKPSTDYEQKLQIHLQTYF